MNGAHDLGGMHGLGSIDPEPETQEPVFHSAWEGRVFAINVAVNALRKWNIDMVRHARERQHPAAYLQQSYYENWLAGLETLLLETGLATPAELEAGKAATIPDEETRSRVLKAPQVPAMLARGMPATVPIETAPRFKAGDHVIAINRHPLGHTREPRYVRGRAGTIHQHHGSHVFPDANAHGLRRGQHLYSVRFEGSSLWGESANRASAVYVDLWEDYLQPAEPQGQVRTSG